LKFAKVRCGISIKNFNELQEGDNDEDFEGSQAYPVSWALPETNPVWAGRGFQYDGLRDFFCLLLVISYWLPMMFLLT
jgi:hypothetical protein